MKLRYNYILSLAFTSFLVASIQAQVAKKDTLLNRMVVVDQDYNPDIMDASKVNVLPIVEEFTVSKKEIEYANGLFPITSFDANVPMQAFVPQMQQTNTKRGYARLGYGNYGNLDVKLNYLFNLSKNDRLGVAASVDGMNGKLKLPANGEKWKSRFYRITAGAEYIHQFSRLDLNIAGHWGMNRFNYIPLTLSKEQTFNSGDIHLGLLSTDETLPIHFKAETNLLLYGGDGVNENIVRTKADVAGVINEEQKIGLALQMDNFFYNKDFFDNYTSLQLKPYYTWSNEVWRLRAGVNVDFSFAFGKALQVSPDVNVQYVFNDSYMLYAATTGGRELNDFRKIEQYCPYAVFNGKRYADTYEQLNAVLGLKMSPMSGLHFHLFGGYQNLKDDLDQLPEMEKETLNFGQILLEQSNTKNVYAGASAMYEYKDLVKFTAAGTYRHWTANDDALIFKPSLELNFGMDVCPIDALTLGIAYRYIQRESTRILTTNTRMSAINNLTAQATYKFYKGVSFFVKLDNVLNRKYQYYYGYPTEGFNFLAGISLSF
ncbi:MAG: TonB-dependent receptor [Bacteroidaceae bacterium]